jgi:FHA domain
MRHEATPEQPAPFQPPVVIAPVAAVAPAPAAWPGVVSPSVPVRQAPAPVRQPDPPVLPLAPPVRQVAPPVRQPAAPMRQVAPPAPPVGPVVPWSAVVSPPAEPVRQVVPPVRPLEPPVREPAAPVRHAAPPVQQAAAPVCPATSYVVTLDTGQAMSVSGWGYIGRHPQAGPGERCNHVIEIDDPNRSLSRTHARFGIDSTGFWVEDRGSANGTSIVRADGSLVRVGAGERLTVPPGGGVRLGDRTFTVEPLT